MENTEWGCGHPPLKQQFITCFFTYVSLFLRPFQFTAGGEVWATNTRQAHAQKNQTVWTLVRQLNSAHAAQPVCDQVCASTQE